MLFWGSFKIMKWRQLFWIAFCVVKLSGTTADSLMEAPAPTSPSTETELSGTGSLAATGALGSTLPTSESLDTARPATATPSSPGLSTVQTSPQQSSQPSKAPTQVPATSPEAASIGVPTTPTPEVDANTTEATQEGTPAPLSSTATSELMPVSEASTEPHVASGVPKPITCHNVKDVSDTGAICLRLNESNTCKQFLEMKGSDLWSAICEESTHPVPSPCHIKLAKSEVDHDCLLLILVNETNPATDMLQESHWEKFGIKSLQRGSVRSHQDFSRKTLTALVTSGLLLAFLGMAGYFLMKRRSWSPAGQRLDEDQYDMEDGSQGSPALTVAGPEPQEKPSLNGAQENGASRNGRSAAQRGLADTPM
ncbi:hematopoietic progenitor cell antigen CD34 isoform X1 [Aythya fuligula]|uniref:Hematopoietic progenitor cell antigen CD34 isoform X1 n=1 Tax=Aythya fuligula TaxID=219594 RepID=A0A6J3E6N5_AYTFU|nr:hematopoietic progenitor cell antigen CD34 isoform X1 [Aythya fuligula]